MKYSKKFMAALLAVIGIVALVLATIIAGHQIAEDRQSKEAIHAYQQNTVSPTNSPPPATPAPTATVYESTPQAEFSPSPAPTATAIPRIPNPYADAYLANEHMVGWLTIPDTVIDYPVMWTPFDENYYLYRDFNEKDNKNGSLILDTDSSLNPLTTNLIIHGHNMKSGAMFGNLTDYEDKNYYENHRFITLHTLECQRNYEVIAVFRSQVFKKTDDVFKFYQFFQADTEEEFQAFYDNIKELSLYETGVSASFGDRFITLSTCTYHVKNGRFVVIAREIDPGEYYEPITQ